MGPRRAVARAAALLLLVTLAVTVAGAALRPAPAAAHTRTQETTNVDSRITSDPGLSGVRWTVHTGGLLVEVENTSAVPLVVEGYEGEPYLRVGPDGVEHNRRSPATYLNSERFGRQTRRDVVAREPVMPPDVDPDAAPEWVHLGDEPRTVWHDHRTHWMSPAPPAFVDAGPLERTLMAMRAVGPVGRAGADAGVFRTWEIPVLSDGRAVVVAGEMAWVDPPSAWPWLLTGALLVAPGLLGLRRADRQAWLRPAALVVVGVALVNAIHLVDDLVAWPSDPLDELSGLLHTTIFLTAALVASTWALLVRWGRVLALAVGSGAVLYHQGLVHLPMLRASRFPTMWPDGLVRLTIALALAQALVVALVLVRCRRASRGGHPSGTDARGRGEGPRDLPEDGRRDGRGDEGGARRGEPTDDGVASAASAVHR